jgi:two-component system LytT family response regulator
MRRFRTILIDDEPLALEQLESLLQRHESVISTIDKAVDGGVAVEKIDSLKPDLIFLDIQMPVLDGFSVLEKVSHIPLTIFTTAYDQYALKAFETHSIDYLLKPIDPARLEKALVKLQRFSDSDDTYLKEELASLLKTARMPLKKRIQVQVGNRILMIDINEIYFFRALDRYVEVNTFEGTYVINDSLKNLEDMLPAQDFVRVHRSAIVNLNFVKEVVKEDFTTFRIKMKDKKLTVLPMSLRAKAQVLKQM